MSVVEIHRHLFTVDDFAHMGEAGILAEDDRVELIDGEIREMTPIGPPHYASAGIPEAWLVDVPGETVTVYTGPDPDGHASERLPRRGEVVASSAVAELRIALDEVLGDRT